MPVARRIGLVFPMLFSLVEALVTLYVVAEGRRCDSECASMQLVVPFTPLFWPLALAGIGEDRHPGPSGVALAYLVTVVLVFAWWWFFTNRLAEWARGSVLRFAAGYVLAVVVTVLLNRAFFGMQDAAGTEVALVGQTALSALVLWRASDLLRRRTAGAG